MDITDFNQTITKMRRDLDDLARRRMPVLAGRIAKTHFQDNFRRSGFVNGDLQPWKPVRRKNGYKPLTSSRNHLFASIKYLPGEYAVTVRNDVSYASIHNWGGTVNMHPAVTPKMRRWAWAQHYANKGNAAEADKWKRLALTGKKKLDIRINMPQRQFLGESRELNEKIHAKLEEEASKIVNL